MDSMTNGDADYPEPYIHQSIAPHTHTIILLHGTSTSGPEFGSPFLSLPFPNPHSFGHLTTLPQLFPGTRWVFPSGKKRKVTVLGGRETNAWFDIHDFSDRTVGEELSVPGLRDSVRFLRTLIIKEVDILRKRDAEREGDGGVKAKERVLGIDGKVIRGKSTSERVVIGGFSQGCAMGVMLLLSGELLKHGVEIGGFMGMSGWLPFRRQFQEMLDLLLPSNTQAESDFLAVSNALINYTRNSLSLSIMDLNWTGTNEKCYLPNQTFLSHGEQDEKVLMKWGKDVRNVLEAAGCQVRFETHGFGHLWCEGGMESLVLWLWELWGVESDGFKANGTEKVQSRLASMN